MLCDTCMENEAVYDMEVNGLVMHLCASCANEEGDGDEVTISEDGVVTVKPPLTCPGCGLTLGELDESRRTGCAQCWITFENVLRTSLRDRQGAVKHVGKGLIPRSSEQQQAVIRRQARRQLEKALATAVAEERYEDAAALRDQLQRMQ